MNPYEPAKTHASSQLQSSLKPEIRRTKFAQDIRSYVNGEICASQLEALCCDYMQSDDPIVQYIAQHLECVSDDYSEIYVPVDKADWDQFQRWLLALEADCRLELRSRQPVTYTQLIAGAALLAHVFLALVVSRTTTEQLLLLLPFWTISAILLSWNVKRRETVPYRDQIIPFASFSDLSRAYHASGFRKQRLPQRFRNLEAPARTSVVAQMAIAIWLPMILSVWVLFTPIVLLVQAAEPQDSVVAN